LVASAQSTKFQKPSTVKCSRFPKQEQNKDLGTKLIIFRIGFSTFME